MTTWWPADARTLSSGTGTTTRHCFSFGAHYDPDNTHFRSLVAHDEHFVQARAGFDWHSHRGVDLVTFVLEGALMHEDTAGHRDVVTAGHLAHQATGAGIQHAERNASADEPVRFVQAWLLSDVETPSYAVRDIPATHRDGAVCELASGALHVLRPGSEVLELPEGEHRHAFVTRGTGLLGGRAVAAGDSVRLSGPATVLVTGPLELLVWSLV